MAYYRLYSLDLKNHHIIDVFSFDETSDSAAILEVQPGDLGVARELWNLGRKVMDFPPLAPLAPDNDEPNHFEKLIGRGGRWRWNPLRDHCQVVA